MHYIKLTKEDIDLKVLLTEELYVELDESGKSIREIGFDENGDIVHIFPSSMPNGTHGLFDMVFFDTSNLESDLSKDEFDKLWFKCCVK